MKKLYKKINEYWFRYKQWGESSIIGNLTVGTVRIVFITTFLVLVYMFFYFLFVVGPFKDKAPSDPVLSDSSSDTVNKDCNIAGINLHGQLLTYIPNHSENDSSSDFNYDSFSSENVVGAIEEANKNPNIKMIVLESDSGGGSPIDRKSV